ncbi:MAG TPA: hypothetical protein VI727_10780 [Candidatus Brocadiaceae bacterium]|nr:hypothetical protein [Candidatus Brocadiaceae bacterium]
MHLNATERYFSNHAPDFGDNHPDIQKAIAYLHQQIDAYAQYGVSFQVATAHGYGRGKKRPNNRDTKVFSDALRSRGIMLFEADIRDRLYDKANDTIIVSDVGGVVCGWDSPRPGLLDETDFYRSLPKGSLIHILSHPGNYNVNRPLTFGLRVNKINV